MVMACEKTPICNGAPLTQRRREFRVWGSDIPELCPPVTSSEKKPAFLWAETDSIGLILDALGLNQEALGYEHDVFSFIRWNVNKNILTQRAGFK